MKCEQANQIDLVEYLYSLGFQPKKIRADDYWYLSPLREETAVSFKVNRSKNVWYDHGIAKGGNVVDFLTEYHRCNVTEALQKLVPFQPQKEVERPPFHLHPDRLINESNARETAIKIIAAKKSIQDLLLCRYLKQRRIDKSIADKYCYEIVFTAGEKEREQRAIGFKNNAGGYELRNEYFKGSSSPKYVMYQDNKADNITVFEGFLIFFPIKQSTRTRINN